MKKTVLNVSTSKFSFPKQLLMTICQKFMKKMSQLVYVPFLKSH